MNYFILAKIGNVNMKKTFQKTLIAAATGVALMSAVGTASANSLLFPYFTTATGAQSVLSLSAHAGTVAPGAGPSAASAALTIHYVYNYGSACKHYDANGSMTPNDILSHSIAATTAGGFGKVVSTDTSTPVYFPLANETGFLVVSSTVNAAPGTAQLRGSMAIVDPASGLVVSYAGIDNALDTSIAGNEGNFAAITDLNFVLTAMPAAMVTTSYYGVVVGNMNAAIASGADWNAGYSMSNGGFIWNNDEVPFSGTSSKAIRCAGSFTATDLMSGAQAAAVGTNGSRVNVTGTAIVPTATNGYVYQSSGAVIMKMQSVQAAVGAPFAGKQFLHRELAGGL
jgi:hypothetical protein